MLHCAAHAAVLGGMPKASSRPDPAPAPLPPCAAFAELYSDSLLKALCGSCVLNMALNTFRSKVGVGPGGRGGVGRRLANALGRACLSIFVWLLVSLVGWACARVRD